MHHLALIIDDDAIIRMALESMLEDWDYSVRTAPTAEDGLRCLREELPDVVLCDVRMPGMSGLEFQQTVRQSHPTLPVVLLTAHGSVKSAVDAIRAGAFDYVLKPPEPEELRLLLARAVEHGRLQRENSRLRSEIATLGRGGARLLGDSPRMREIHELIRRVARTDSTVLVTGETGTGKELVARTIHYQSPRAEFPLVSCNCAAFNANLLESELFGHEKGAFTGATSARRGRFEEADGGTLFLDEIGETSREFQAKLLRVLQEREFERVGGNRRVAVDVRVIASTNRDLAAEVEARNFREDLYYRLRVVPIHLPPLRERREDILPLATAFLDQFRQDYGGPAHEISAEAAEWLARQEWRGNVRELRHCVERAVVLAEHARLEPADFAMGDAPPPAAGTPETLERFLDQQTAAFILRKLDENAWKKQQTAEQLGIDRATLYRLIQKHRLGERETP